MMMMMTMTVNLIMIVMSPQDQEEEGIVDIDDDDEEEEEDPLEVMILTCHHTHLIPLTMIPTLHILIIAVATALMNTQLTTLEEDVRIAEKEKC